ncbi:acyltransferase domain-containing protein [Bombilactobacillus bombi]|uniref:acyltransferase domain-containing protein n=1 Tax=Bombilactobacillus bombi TaxID=1303590 RepID=UPI0028127BC4|nr:acyltransferase domain-containing protein [Bombilactobacillus bombi]
MFGYSIRDSLNDAQDRLNLTEYTQPALFVVSALSYLDKKRKGIVPDYMIGHSLGELSALFAAGAFSFQEGLKLVKTRAQLMSQQKHGGMSVVTANKW